MTTARAGYWNGKTARAAPPGRRESVPRSAPLAVPDRCHWAPPSPSRGRLNVSPRQGEVPRGPAPRPAKACSRTDAPTSSFVAALPVVYHGIPVPKVLGAQDAQHPQQGPRNRPGGRVKADVHAVMNATSRRKAESATRCFADRWETIYPKAAACLRNDLDDLLTCFAYGTMVNVVSASDCPASCRVL